MTHKWDYEQPECQWEEWPWWVRWPVALLAAAFFTFMMTAPWHPWMNWPH